MNPKLSEKMKRAVAGCNIHGISELFESNSKWVKMFWVIVLVTGFSNMVFNVYHLLHYYHSNPTSTTVSAVFWENYFPDILICPPMRYNRDVYKIDTDIFEFILSQRFYSDRLADTVNSTDAFELQKHFAEKVDNFLVDNNLTSVDEFLERIWPSPEEMFFPNFGFFHNDFKVETVQTNDDMCYRLTANETLLHWNYFSANGIRFSAFLRNLTNEPKFPLVPGSKYPNLIKLYFGIQANELIEPRGETWLELGYDYSIKLETITYSRVQKCTKVSNLTEYACTMECVYGETDFLRCSNCVMYLPHNNVLNALVNSTSDYCSGHYYKTLCNRSHTAWRKVIKQFENCYEKCQKPCIEWYDRASTFTLRRTPENKPYRIDFGLMNAYNSIIVEEHYLVTFSGLIGQIGGLVAVYCGASILAVAQLLYNMLK